MDYTFDSIEDERKAFFEEEKYQGVWLPIAAVAANTGLTAWAIQKYVNENLVQSVKLRNSALLVRLQDIEELLQNGGS
jgi:hypothetical protein